MATECLYDAGEEQWRIKAHVGCGNIYLDGYRNYDLSGFSVQSAPELCEQNKTTISDYYARLDGSIEKLPVRRPTVVDDFCDMMNLPYAFNTVNKIVAIQCFEHQSPMRALETLISWRNILALNGVLVMSVPDIYGTLDLLATGYNLEFCVRHLRGSARDDYNWHSSWYTNYTLAEMLHSAGFVVETLPNIHLYPAICVRAVKA